MQIRSFIKENMSNKNPPPPHLFLTGNPGVGKSTIIIHLVQKLLENLSQQIRVRGFYTQECRQDGNRMGFDIVTWDADSKRAPLARIGNPKKHDPHVGKYIVDVANVDRVAVPSIAPPLDANGTTTDLVVIDEVGKMELLCPTFPPAVKRVLDFCSGETKRNAIVLGTIPTPRYGRVISAVEEIRSRPDVIVVEVTKSNREDLCREVQRVILSALRDEGRSMREDLQPYLYARPIGASSQDPLKRRTESCSGSRLTSGSSRACGPLLDPTVLPRVLLLGETASPIPQRTGMEYSERSMWKVLAEVFQIPYDSEQAENFIELRKAVTGSGVAIWDVLSNVHKKSEGQKPRKRERRESDIPNPLDAFLCNHETVVALLFIGRRARLTFGKHLDVVPNQKTINLSSRCLQLVELPSSSPANSRMTVYEKAHVWKTALSDFCPDLKG